MTIAHPLRAELPAVKLMTAPLVTPANAWTAYGSGTTHTTTTVGWTSATRPAEIKELARALGRAGAITGDAYAAAVVDYVRDNIQTEFRFGLSKGARGALVDQSGTPFDQAHLMVELLREGGVSASYQVGTVTLSAAEFQTWTGLTNAAASCQYLADGGIPATVNGASACSGLTGSLTTVTLGHIWVSANSKLYDPSYKKHVFKTGVDLAVALGCGTAAAPTCASTVLSRIPAPTTVSGVQRIAGIPGTETNINSDLRGFAVNLQNWIQSYNATNNTVLSLEDVIGGKLIDTSAVFTPGATLPYSSSVQYSWPGDIPDQYRTTLRVQMDSIDQTLFVDELAGKRLRIWGQGAGQNDASYSRTAALYVEYKPLAKSTRANASSTNAVLTLTADHPYAAVSGGYMDEQMQRTTDFGIGLYTEGSGGCCLNVLTLVNGWGEATQSTVSHFAALAERDLNSTTPEDPSSSNHYWLFKPTQAFIETPCYAVTPAATPAPDPGCYEQHQPSAAATWLAEASHMAKMAAQLSGAVVQMHHSLGWVLSGEKVPVSVLNVESSLSAMSTTAVAADRQAAYLGITAGLSRLEGSVFEQIFDSWDGGSGVSYLVKSNAKGIASLWVDSANVTAAKLQLSNYSTARKSVIDSYTGAGFSLVVPQNGYLGSYSYSSGNTLTINTNGMSAYQSTGDRVAYLVDGRFKGASAGSAVNPAEAALNSAKVMEYSVKGRKYYGVSLAGGELTLSPPPDLISGSAEFPLSLPFRRFYNSSTPLVGLDDSSGPLDGGARDPYLWQPSAQTVSDIGGGWSHNYDISAKMESDGFKAMGQDSAREASAAIAALFTLSKLNAGTTGFATHLATVFTTNWWIARLQNNVVVVRRPPATSVFTRLPDDTGFSPEPGSSEILTQSGNRLFKVWLNNFGSGYNYNGTGFSLTDAAGTVTSFSYLTTNAYNQNIAVPISQTSASGARVTFTNKGTGSGGCIALFYQCLSSVSNSLGRSLSLDASTIADETGRQVQIKSSEASGNNSMLRVPTKYIVTVPGGGVTTYQYVANPMAAIERPYPRIYRWYTPSSSATPYITAEYDRFYRAKAVTDNLAHRTDHYVSGLFGSENQKPASSKDPLGNVTTTAIDGDGQTTSQTDPLGRASKKVYDNARRLIREVNPEGDAVEYQYDIRSNRTRECRIAKGRVDWSTFNSVTEQAPQCNAGAGDLVTTTVYMEGPAVWPCSNAKTCNRPNYEIDPKGNRTTYTWNATHGQLETVTTGLNSAGSCALAGGVCPVTTYGYTSFTGTDGAIFYLLTSKQERLDPTNSAVTRTTSWAYNNAAAKFTLKEQVVDGGGLALRTCFKFDAVGNLISKTEPKAGLGSCP